MSAARRAVPRQGYRFVAAVEIEPRAAPAAAVPPADRRWRARAAWGLAIVTALLLRFVNHFSEYRADQEEALAAFEQAARCAPDHAEAWLQMARLLTALGSHDRALAAYTEVLRLRLDDVEGWLLQAEAANQAGQHDKALTASAEVLRRTPDGTGEFELELQRDGSMWPGFSPLRETRVRARLREGTALARLGRSAETCAAFGAALARRARAAPATANPGGGDSFHGARQR